MTTDTMRAPRREELPNLETAIAYYQGKRWTAATVSAARMGLWPDDPKPAEWAERLDEEDGIDDEERQQRRLLLRRAEVA
jgi:hypothetical protein